MRKKIVFVIVEGPSDQNALGSVLSHLFADELVHVHVVGGDITAQTPVSKDIQIRVSELVKAEASIYHWRASDIARIIHIVDTDGAFIPDERIVLDSTRKHIRYYSTEIRTQDPDSIMERNHRKQYQLKKLVKVSEVWRAVPYQVYYMSCNLDHVLYGQINLPDKDKVDYAYRFSMTYRDQPDAFVEFMEDSPFAVDGTYRETWEYIRKGCRSLERHSNLHLAFEAAEGDEEENDRL